MSIANERKRKLAKVRINEYGIIMLDGNMNGKRHRLTTGKKADKRLLQWYENHIEDEFFKLHEAKFGATTNGAMLFSEYGEYILDISKGNRNEFSQKEVEQQFKKLCETFGSMKISDIKASHILKWQNSCGYAPKTILNYRGTMNLIMKMALYDDIVSRNPLTVVKAPKKIKGNVDFFNQEEMEHLVKSATGQLKNVLLLAFFSGLRGSEIIALKWSHIDFVSETITVEERIREGVVDTTKSKVERVIDMLPQAKKALKAQQLRTGIKGEYIFISKYGKTFQRPDALSRSLKTLCANIGVKIGTLQTVRRSCNTLFKQYGLPNDWILDTLGHMDDIVNREHYTGRLKPDLSKIGRVLAG